MHRGCWMNVLKGYKAFVFIYLVCRDFAFYNFSKNGRHAFSCKIIFNACNASCRVSQTEIKRPLWQKMAPGMPVTCLSSSSNNPAHFKGKGCLTCIRFSYVGGM